MSSEKKKDAAKTPAKRTNLRLLLTAAAVALSLGVVFLSGTGVASAGGAAAVALGESLILLPDAASGRSGTTSGEAVTIDPGESLVIPTADITEDASFFAVEVDGTKMEVIAVKDSSGKIRTAYNTCQICYGSGRGYYKQSGRYLVCQNCGNRFSMDQVEVRAGGCNPWPIFDENKTVTEDAILISYDDLAKAQTIFENWKAAY